MDLSSATPNTLKGVMIAESCNDVDARNVKVRDDAPSCTAEDDPNRAGLAHGRSRLSIVLPVLHLDCCCLDRTEYLYDALGFPLF